jgi:hypothetical protein
VPAGPRLPRRTAIALAAAGLVALAGCDDGEKSASAPTSTPDPDVALVDRVLVELANAERLAEAAGLTELSAMHRAHIEVLGGPEPTPAAARMSVPVARRKEQHLQRHLAAAAQEAESGALARVFASMSAAVAQRLAGGLA